jgi:hypothetical protein
VVQWLVRGGEYTMPVRSCVQFPYFHFFFLAGIFFLFRLPRCQRARKFNKKFIVMQNYKKIFDSHITAIFALNMLK